MLYLYRCAGAGHIRDDIVSYTKELKQASHGNEEQQASLIDMGVKALRLDKSAALSRSNIFELFYVYSAFIFIFHSCERNKIYKKLWEELPF